MTTNFGRDTSCTTSLRTGRFSTGARLVAEAAFRRLTTPRGKLRGGEEEANYGLDLSEYVGNNSPSAVAAMPGRISAELEKDPRIQSTTVTAVASTVAGQTSVTITVKADTNVGPFALQIAIGLVTVELLGIKADS